MAAFVESRKTATYLTVVLTVLFALIVWVGWWYLLKPTATQVVVAPGAATLLTTLAYICARLIGRYRARLIVDSQRQQWYRGWHFYILLAIISFIGTLNTAFFLFESKAILRDDISTVRNAYANLRDIAHRDLLPPEYHLKKDQVNGLLKALREEIVNQNGGNYCGYGKAARDIVRSITGLLPGYHEINGSAPIKPCDMKKAEKLYESYEGMATEMLKADPYFVKIKAQEKVALLTRIDNNYLVMSKTLGDLEKRSAGIGPAEALSKNGLYEARGNYNSDRGSFLSLMGKEYDGVDAINTLQSETISSYASTIDLAYKRIMNITTWIYIAVAFAIDLSLIYLLTKLSFYRMRDDKEQEAILDPEIKRFKTDPKFLWVNP